MHNIRYIVCYENVMYRVCSVCVRVFVHYALCTMQSSFHYLFPFAFQPLNFSSAHIHTCAVHKVEEKLWLAAVIVVFIATATAIVVVAG